MMETALVISNGHFIELDGTGLDEEPPTLHLHEQIIDAEGKPIYIMDRVHLSFCDLIASNVVIAGTGVALRHCKLVMLCDACRRKGKERA